MKIDIEKLIRLVNERKTVPEISRELKSSIPGIWYQLEKLNLKDVVKRDSRFLQYAELSEKHCPVCKLTKPITDFYQIQKGSKKKARSSCIICDRNRSKTERLIRYTSFKTIAINYKGGKCIVCGYNKCFAAMDFHHIKGDSKESTIADLISKSSGNSKSPIEFLKSELDKCVLLCANCHREYHAGFITLPLEEIVLKEEPKNVVI